MKIAIVGCGNMGMAFAKSFLQYDLVKKENLLLIEKSAERADTLRTENTGVVIETISTHISEYDVVILSVKPQDFNSVTEALRVVIQPQQVVLSIMAGRSVFLEDEAMLDAVTALSGSGPAYFYYLVKSMVEAGKRMGFEESMATLLVKQTMLGSFHLINNADKSLDDLIKAVASKGGTTEAALREFENGQLSQTLHAGILAAEHRAKELSKG